MKIRTSDLCDAHPKLGVAEPLFADFGGADDFHGRIETLKVFEDNALLRVVLEEPAAGRILVVDGGGSRRCALLGGNLAARAAANGWGGLVIYGCVRDTHELLATAIGIKALAAHPRRSDPGLHAGVRHRAVHFAGVAFQEGHWLYADADGIVVSPLALHGGTGS